MQSVRLQANHITGNKTVQERIYSGPSPEVHNRGGQRPKGWGTFSNTVQYWMYAATGGPNMKWGAQISDTCRFFSRRYFFSYFPPRKTSN